METWEPGDRVFLFGFSRGAYTVRVLAGLLYALGLLPRNNPNLVPYVIRLFESLRGTDPDAGSNYWKLCDQFRWTFARQVVESDDQRRFPVHFLGVWDTVSSVGWVWDPKTYPYTTRNPGIAVVRHAVSLDERRCFFRQNLAKPADGQDCREFGSRACTPTSAAVTRRADGSLWRPPVRVDARRGEGRGLLVDDRAPRAGPPRQQRNRPLERHEARVADAGSGGRRSFSRRWSGGPAEERPELGLGRHRRIETPIELHRSTLLRIKGPTRLRPAESLGGHSGSRSSTWPTFPRL